MWGRVVGRRVETFERPRWRVIGQPEQPPMGELVVVVGGMLAVAVERVGISAGTRPY